MCDIEDADDSDAVTDVADGLVPIYTHHRFQVFVDLCAYQEDIQEYWGSVDFEGAAGMALFQIAARLLYALLEARRQMEQKQ